MLPYTVTNVNMMATWQIWKKSRVVCHWDNIGRKISDCITCVQPEVWRGRIYIAAELSHWRLVTQDGINPCRGGPGQDTEDFYAQYGAAWREQEWNNTRGEPLDLHCDPRSEQTLSITAGSQAGAAAPRLAGSWKAQSLLESHSTQVLFSKSWFWAHRSSSLEPQGKEGA